MGSNVELVTICRIMLACAFAMVEIWGLCGAVRAQADTLDEWTAKQLGYSQKYLLENISPTGAARGAVVASPSKSNPNYFYHWIRDASLTMGVVIDLYERASVSTKPAYERLISDFIEFSRQNQLTPNPSGGLGEPKFNADGSAFTGSWGRPQNDGPALRAITLIRVANLWLADGRESLVRQKLYRPGLPANTIIKADLEFVSHRWRETGFDLWEEIRGHHFYTEMVQRKALVEGADLAESLGDPAAAGWYRQEAKALEAELQRHWDNGRNILNTTLDRDGGIDYKNSGIDASTILAVMHGETRDGFFSVADSRVEATARALEQTYASIYEVNKKGFPGLAIGRYPEDRYDGFSVGPEGNPWVLLTAGFGEYYHRLASAYETRGRITIEPANAKFFQALTGQSAWRAGLTLQAEDARFALLVGKLRARGDDFFERVRRHGLAEGHFSEQMNRYSGYMQGARDLTWNYAALLTALWRRR